MNYFGKGFMKIEKNTRWNKSKTCERRNNIERIFLK